MTYNILFLKYEIFFVYYNSFIGITILNGLCTYFYLNFLIISEKLWYSNFFINTTNLFYSTVGDLVKFHT